VKQLSRKLKRRDKKKVHLIALHNPKSPITEQYRLIRNNLHFSSVDKEVKSIVVTSPEPSDGKSTTAANLAVVLTQKGNRVLLVDTDLRKPTVHFTFNVSNMDGLTSVLTRDIELEEALHHTYISNLDILTSGPMPPNPSELLDSKAMEKVMEELKESYDYIVYDTPPILVVTDSQFLANKSDGVVLVISSGKTKKEVAIKAKGILEMANSQLLGIIVNGVKQKNGSNYSQYY
jgi:capsular exopolysaccharide synthesis family protein